MGFFIAFTSVIFICRVGTLISHFVYPFCKLGHTPCVDWLTTRGVRKLFRLMKTYLKFDFIRDYEHFDELPEQFMVISNHQSLLDIPMCMDYFEGDTLRFFTKAELMKGIPMVSRAMRKTKHCPLKRRGNPRNDMKNIEQFSRRIKYYGWNPVLFPEGTRSRNGELGKFHRAGFRRSMDLAPLPIAVCALDGVWKVATLAGIKKNMKKGSCRMKLLGVLPQPKNKEEQIEALETARRLIENQLTEWRTKK